MFRVEVHPDVFAELEHSRAWYEERAASLGEEFLDEVNRAVETIRATPASGRLAMRNGVFADISYTVFLIMKEEYDFSKGLRGRINAACPILSGWKLLENYQC
jgi:hypothetical protein